MRRYSIEPRRRKYIKRYGFLSFAGLHAVKTASKKVVYKAGEFLGNKTTGTVTKSKNNNIEKEPVEEIGIPPEKIYEILNKLRKVL